MLCDRQEDGAVICAAKMKTDTPFLSKVEPLRSDFERWRQNRKRGEHIPESLWEAAAKLAVTFGVGRVSRALGVGYYALKERSQDGCQPSRNQAAAFIELPLPTPTARIDYLVELEDGRGAKMTLRLAPGSGNEVLALAQAFWRRQP
jgi:hypothetical protein